MKSLIYRGALALLTLSACCLTLAPVTQAASLDPEQIATRAYWGEFKGIPGYSLLQRYWRAGVISTEDIIKASGETPTPELTRRVNRWLSDLLYEGKS